MNAAEGRAAGAAQAASEWVPSERAAGAQDVDVRCAAGERDAQTELVEVPVLDGWADGARADGEAAAEGQTAGARVAGGRDAKGAEAGACASNARDAEGLVVGDRIEEGLALDERAAAGRSALSCDAEMQVEGPREGVFEYRGLRLRYLVWEPRGWEAVRPGAEGGPGSESAPLVLLHGFAQSAWSWAQAAPLLARGHSVYALDLTGHGGSDRPDSPEPYKLSAQGEALLAFLETLADVERATGAAGAASAAADAKCPEGVSPFACATSGGPASSSGPAASDAPAASAAGAARCGGAASATSAVSAAASAAGAESARSVAQTVRKASLPVLVGYSMGGRVALSALVGAPEAFADCAGGLVLESAGLGPASAEERARAARADAERAAHLREAGVEAFMDEWERLPLFASQERLSPEVRARVRQERLANDAEALARTIEGAGQHAMPSREQTLAALEGLAAAGVPVLYLAGSLDAKYAAVAESLNAPDAGDPKAAAPLAPGAPGIDVRIVEGAGHNIHLEAPEAFCGIVEAFLTDAEDFAGVANDKRDKSQVTG